MNDEKIRWILINGKSLFHFECTRVGIYALGINLQL